MHKIRAIALREYLAAVKAKAFLVTILLMPVMMGGSIGLQVLFQKLESEKEKKYALIDRTPGHTLAPALQLALAMNQEAPGKKSEGKGEISRNISFVVIPPSALTPEAMGRQRFEVSQQIETGEFAALIEIGPAVLEHRANPSESSEDKADDSHAVRFQTKSAGAHIFRRTLEALLNQVVFAHRLGQKGLTERDIKYVFGQRVDFHGKALTRQDPATGAFQDAADETPIINLVLPGALIALMFMVIMIGATPAMHGIIEEKSQRIAEVLLGSVTPFQLMAGKLLGVIGVALTMSFVYLGGGFFIMNYFGYANLVPVSLLIWFLPMLVLALLIFGSLFIAVGAAAADIKDTQTLLMPIMLIACIPFFALGPIMQDPNGPIARVCSFFPFATPMLLVARESVPPGVPWWEMLAGIVLVLATTLACVWAASRIFRVGILMQGKGPKFADLIRWAIKG